MKGKPPFRKRMPFMHLPVTTIRSRRLEKGWSLQKLADACQTGKSQIDKLERGQRRLSVEWMVRLAKALECDPRDLFGTPATKPRTARSAKTTPPLPLRIYRASSKTGDQGSLSETVGGVPCPFFLAQTPDAYALYVQSDAMRPMFRGGQILFLAPRERPAAEKGVLILKKDGSALLAAFSSCAKGRLHVQTFFPKSRAHVVQENDVDSLCVVMGCMES